MHLGKAALGTQGRHDGAAERPSLEPACAIARVPREAVDKWRRGDAEAVRFHIRAALFIAEKMEDLLEPLLTFSRTLIVGRGQSDIGVPLLQYTDQDVQGLMLVVDWDSVDTRTTQAFTHVLVVFEALGDAIGLLLLRRGSTVAARDHVEGHGRVDVLDIVEKEVGIFLCGDGNAEAPCGEGAAVQHHFNLWQKASGPLSDRRS